MIIKLMSQQNIQMVDIGTELSCGLCSSRSSVGDIGRHLAIVHVGSSGSDWICADRCAFRTSSEAEMASHCLLTKHPAVDVRRLTTFTDILAQVQQEFNLRNSTCLEFNKSDSKMAHPETKSDPLDPSNWCAQNEQAENPLESEVLVQTQQEWNPGQCAPTVDKELKEALTAEVTTPMTETDPHSEEEPDETLDEPILPNPRPPIVPKLLQHISSRPQLTCSFCHRYFSKSFNRALHERTHTNDRPYACDECGESFRRSDHIRDHSHIHSKTKPFICHVCGKGYCQVRTLQMHRKVHKHNPLPDEPEMNSQPAISRLVENSVERLPEETVQKGFPFTFKCHFCESTFAMRKDRKEHEWIRHSRDGRYMCPHCPFSRTSQGLVVAHIRSHDKPQFKCPNCAFSSHNRYSFRRHIARTNYCYKHSSGHFVI